MPKRVEPDEGFDGTKEQVKKAIKLLENEVSLDFLNMLGSMDIYTQVMLQLDWRQLQALRVVSASHRHWAMTHGTDRFWRSVFMADIVDNSKDARINEDFVNKRYEELDANESEPLREPDQDEENSTKLSVYKRNTWEKMYAAILKNPNAFGSDTSWFHKDLEIVMMFRKCVKDSTITSGYATGEKISLPIPNDNFMDEHSLRPKYCKKMEDFYDERSGKEFYIVPVQHHHDVELPLFVSRMKALNEHIKFNEDRHVLGYLGANPHLTIFDDYLDEVIEKLFGIYQKQRKGLLKIDNLPPITGWTLISTFSPYGLYDIRAYKPVLLLVDKRTENGKRVLGEMGKHVASMTPLFSADSSRVEREELDSLWAFGDHKSSSVSVVQRFRQLETSSRFVFHLSTVKNISGLFNNTKRRQEYYRKYAKKVNSEGNLHGDENIPYQIRSLIQRKEGEKKLLLVTRQSVPGVGRLAFENGEPFCNHEIPVECYEQWVLKRDENIKRGCPLCPGL